MSRLGRPAGPAADTVTTVLTAALDLLLTEGAASLTPLRLHQVTGVSRSTIYRHWASPTDVLAGLIEVAPDHDREPTGDLGADLHAEVDLLCDRLRDRPVAAFLQALVAIAVTDEAAVELRQRYVFDLIEPFRTLLLDAGYSRERMGDAVSWIVAPLVVDALLDQPPSRERAHRAADLFVTGADQASQEAQR